MNKLTDLPNIGPKISAQLHQVGIHSPEQLLETGSREAWLLIQKIDPSACYNRLCALEGAMLGLRRHELTPQVRISLKEFYKNNKIKI